MMTIRLDSTMMRVLSQFVEQNKLTYRSISTIQNDDLTDVDEWVASALMQH